MTATESASLPYKWLAVLAVLTAAVVWAGMAFAANGSGSASSSSGQPMAGYSFAATGNSHSSGDCPNMGGSGGSGTQTTPNGGGGTTTTPSQSDGSSNPGL